MERDVPLARPGRPPRGAGPIAALALALAAGCSLPPEAGVSPVRGADPLAQHLRYLDGQVSPNSTCAVRTGNRLNPRIPPVRINGRPIGFC